MKNEKVYPEWVQRQRIKGTTVKKVGNTYYLYKRIAISMVATGARVRNAYATYL